MFGAMYHNGKKPRCSANYLFNVTHIENFLLSDDCNTDSACFLRWIIVFNLGIYPNKLEVFDRRSTFQNIWQWTCLEIQLHHLLNHVFSLNCIKFTGRIKFCWGPKVYTSWIRIEYSMQGLIIYTTQLFFITGLFFIISFVSWLSCINQLYWDYCFFNLLQWCSYWTLVD